MYESIKIQIHVTLIYIYTQIGPQPVRGSGPPLSHVQCSAGGSSVTQHDPDMSFVLYVQGRCARALICFFLLKSKIVEIR